MAVLTARKRASLPSSTFALPGRRFPINDKTHARVAKSYASRMVKRGQLSADQKRKIDAKADRKLAMAGGGLIKAGLGLATVAAGAHFGKKVKDMAERREVERKKIMDKYAAGGKVLQFLRKTPKPSMKRAAPAPVKELPAPKRAVPEPTAVEGIKVEHLPIEDIRMGKGGIVTAGKNYAAWLKKQASIPGPVNPKRAISDAEASVLKTPVKTAPAMPKGLRSTQLNYPEAKGVVRSPEVAAENALPRKWHRPVSAKNRKVGGDFRDGGEDLAHGGKVTLKKCSQCGAPMRKGHNCGGKVKRK